MASKDILISGVIALLLHGLILSLPMAGRGNRPLLSRPRPIALSLIHPKAPVTAPSHMSTPPCPAPPAQEPRPEDQAAVSLKNTVVSKKEPAAETCPPAVEQPAPPSPRQEAPEPKPVPRPAKDLSPVQQISTGPNTDAKVEPASPAPAIETAFKKEDLFSWGQRTVTAHQGDPQGKDVVVFARPRYKENPAPSYPKVARQRGYEGETLLRVEVLETGDVGQVEIESSSGFGVLDRAALDCVKDWGFVPGEKNGKRIRQWVMVPIRFSLR